MRVAILSGSHQVADSFAYESEHLFSLCGGNVGNFAIISSMYWHITKMVEHVDIVPWSISPDVAKERYDVIVFACANMLGSHTDLGGMASLLEKIGLPVIAIGLGAQADDLTKDVSITAGTRRWVEVMIQLAPASKPNIGVRGAYTLAQLEKLGFGGHAVVTGCTSNLINPHPDLGTTLAKKWALRCADRVAVPAGLPYWPHLMLHERELIKIVDRTQGVYIAQHDIDMVRICRDEFDRIPTDRFSQICRYLAPQMDERSFQKWCRRYSVCFNDASSWLEAMRKFDVVIGARFHGVMFGIQAGTPGAVITHDSRTQELCRTMAIPSKHYSEIKLPFDENSFYDSFEFDAQVYSRTRSELCAAYVEILSGAGLQAGPELIAIRDTA